MKLRLGLIAISMASGCADPALSTDRAEVINGQVTPAGKFPGVGALMYDFGGGAPEFGCTGTLIAPDAVLTAAHCLFDAPSVPGFTLALDTGASPVVVPGMMAVPHEMFDFNNIPAEGLGEVFDVGVLLLAEPITEVEPVPMARPEDSANIVASLAMEIAGYGETAGGSAGVMQDATTTLISLNSNEIQVGMGLPQPQNCYGDSGGPGFAQLGDVRRVIGIVSRSFVGEECTMGGVDTRVDAYLSWIHDQVGNVPCDSGMSPACEPPEPPPDPDPEPSDTDEGGCCSTSAGIPDGSILLALALAFRLRRRRTS